VVDNWYLGFAHLEAAGNISSETSSGLGTNLCATVQRPVNY
jgi:hypothetical protein